MTLSESAVEAMYRTHAPTLYRVCLRYVRNAADAEDLVQAAFIRILESAREWRGEGAPLTWAYRIAVNEALMFLRRRKGRPDGLPILEEEMDCPDTGQGDIHLRLTLRQVLDRCPEDIQETAVLHYLEGMTQEEVSEATRIPLRTVELKLSRFRSLARKWLPKEV